MIVDDFYAFPEQIRETALTLSFAAPPYPYPGRIAKIEESASLATVKQTVLDFANRLFLPRVPPIKGGGVTIASFGQVMTDFAVTDIHPDELLPQQRVPHVDPVPVFGLVYLSPRSRGGTLFFRATGKEQAAAAAGYITKSNSDFELCAGIEGAFNRLVIYPGFVPHSGEIVGDWIKTEERFTDPRLTQRFVFFP